MPIFFGSVVFIVSALAALALAAIALAPVVAVPLAILLILLAGLGIRSRVQAARTSGNSRGPEVKWREQTKAANR